MKPYIRKSGGQRGKVIGHHNCPIRLDIWEMMMKLKEDLDMELYTQTDFLLYIVTFVRDHFNKGEELEAMKSDVKKATGRLDLKSVEEMTDEEAKELYEKLLTEGEKDESSDIP